MHIFSDSLISAGKINVHWGGDYEIIKLSGKLADYIGWKAPVFDTYEMGRLLQGRYF